MATDPISNLRTAGYSEEDIQAWRQQKREELAASGHTYNEIDSVIGRDTRRSSIFNNETMRTLFSDPEYVKTAQPKHLRETYDAVNASEDGMANEKYAVVAFMSETYGVDPSLGVTHYDAMMRRYFNDEELTPKEHYKRIGEMLMPKLGKPQPDVFTEIGKRPVPGQVQGASLEEIAEGTASMTGWLKTPKNEAALKAAKKTFDNWEKGSISEYTGSDRAWEEAKKLAAATAAAEIEYEKTVRDYAGAVPKPFAPAFMTVVNALKSSGETMNLDFDNALRALSDAGNLIMDRSYEPDAELEAQLEFRGLMQGAYREAVRNGNSSMANWFAQGIEVSDQSITAVMLGGKYAAAVFGARAFGRSYAEMREKEIDPAVAGPVAFLAGIAESELERLTSFLPGQKVLLSGIKSIPTKIIFEAFTEGAQAVSEKAWTDVVAKKMQKWAGLNENADTEIAPDILKQFAKDFATESWEAMKIMPFMLGTGAGLSLASMKMKEASWNAYEEQAYLKEMAEVIEKEVVAYEAEVKAEVAKSADATEEVNVKDAELDGKEESEVPANVDVDVDAELKLDEAEITQLIAESKKPADTSIADIAGYAEGLEAQIKEMQEAHKPIVEKLKKRKGKTPELPAQSDPGAAKDLMAKPDLNKQDLFDLEKEKKRRAENNKRVSRNDKLDAFRAAVRKTGIKKDGTKEFTDANLSFYSKKGSGALSVDQWVKLAIADGLVDQGELQAHEALGRLMQGENIVKAYEGDAPLVTADEIEIGEVINVDGTDQVVIEKGEDGSAVAVGGGVLSRYRPKQVVAMGDMRRATAEQLAQAESDYETLSQGADIVSATENEGSTYFDADEVAQLTELGRQLEKAAGRLGAGVNPDLVRLFSKIAAIYVKAGVRNSKPFFDKMINKFGEGIDEALQEAWDAALKSEVVAADAPTPEKKRSMSEDEYLEKKEFLKAYEDAGSDPGRFLDQQKTDIDAVKKQIKGQIKELGDTGDQLKQARLKAMLQLLNYDVPPIERRSWARAAEDVLKNNTTERVDEILAEVSADRNRVLSDEEAMAVNIVLTEREQDRLELVALSRQKRKAGDVAYADLLDRKVDLLEDVLIGMGTASMKARSRAGRALAVGRWSTSRRMAAEEVPYIVERAKGAPLTPEEYEATRGLYKRYVEALEELKKVTERAQVAEQALLEEKAGKATKDIITERRKRTTAQLDLEESKILNSLKKLGVKVNEVTGLAGEALTLLAQLARVYVEKGITNLDEIVDKTKNSVPDATRTDVFVALAMQSKGQQKRIETEVSKIMRALKRQAEIEVELSKAGIEADNVADARRLVKELRKPAKDAAIESKKLARLNEMINNLENMLENEHRAIKKKRARPSEAVAERRELIKKLKAEMRTQDRISDLENQIETKNFPMFSAERTAAALSEEQLLAKTKIKKMQKEIRLYAESLKPKTVGEKAFSVANDITQLMRMMAASGELSLVGRQGLIPMGYLLALGGKGWKKTGEIFSESFKAMLSQSTFDNLFTMLDENAQVAMAVDFGLEITDPTGKLNNAEEFFASRLLSQMPWVKLSERQGIAFINLMRVAMFQAAVDMHPEWTAKQIKLWAKFVNATSGRSDLKQFLGKRGMEWASLLLFAPNFAASRIETILRTGWNLVAFNGMAKETSRALAGYAGFQLLFAGMMWAAGASFGDDPEEFDIGRWTIGNTKFDSMAGLNTPARAMILSVMHLLHTMGLIDMKGRKASESIQSFLRNKQAPAIPALIQQLTGQDFWGQEQPRWELALNAVLPMYWRNIWEAAESGGAVSAETGMTVLTGLLGSGIATVENRLMQPKIRDLLKLTGIDKVNRIQFDDKDRDYMVVRENLNKKYWSEIADVLLEKEKEIMSADKYDMEGIKEDIRDIMTDLRNEAKWKYEDIKTKGVK